MSEVNYMVDIEALGHSRDCIVVSVGIVKFKIRTCEILDEKYWELDMGGQKKLGRTIDTSTIQWWMGQTKESQQAISNTKRIEVLDFINEFEAFIKEPGYYWAKGTNYDFEILTNLFQQYWHDAPFKYSKWIDARVYYFLGKQLGILPKKKNEFAHNALIDALFQTEVVCEVHKQLQEGVKCLKQKK